MLPEFFIDWWYAPWTYATAKPGGLLADADQVGQRDGYHLWCAQAGVVADFPVRLETAWHVAATTQGTDLIAAAALFAGLVAAREHDRLALAQLSLSDRRWCMGIAMSQPLTAQAKFAPATAIEIRGLLELACRLEREFPGMWSRLRLVLPPTPAAAVDAMLKSIVTEIDAGAAEARRARRCWTHCHDRVLMLKSDAAGKPV